MTRERFIQEYQALVAKAGEIARLHCLAGDYGRGFYPDTFDTKPGVTPEGMQFYDLIDEPYSEGRMIGSEIVPWAEINDFDQTVAELKLRIERVKREQAEHVKAVRREHYERMKKEFGDE